jgi:hypothetical protein
MKTSEKQADSEMRAEYNFKSMKGGVRGKFVSQYRAGTNLVLLDPMLAKAFPTEAAVNEALLAVLNMMKVVRLPREATRTSAQKGRQR